MKYLKKLEKLWGDCDEIEQQLIVVIAALAAFRLYLAVAW
jgi:hypothetical protein